MRWLSKQLETISLEAQEGAMDDDDDPFKGMVDDGEDSSAVDESEFDLNQYRVKLDQT